MYHVIDCCGTWRKCWTKLSALKWFRKCHRSWRAIFYQPRLGMPWERLV